MTQSAPMGIDGFTLTNSVDDQLNVLLRLGGLCCHYCASPIHADSFQVIAFNGGILEVPPFPDTPYHDNNSQHHGKPRPCVYCGCGDSCLARDMAAGLEHLRSQGVLR